MIHQLLSMRETLWLISSQRSTPMSPSISLSGVKRSHDAALTVTTVTSHQQ